jgi:D-lyxose ketol-isomerase
VVANINAITWLHKIFYKLFFCQSENGGKFESDNNRIAVCRCTITANEQVLLQVGYSLNVKPGTAAWFCFQAEDNILLLGVVRRPETEA